MGKGFQTTNKVIMGIVSIPSIFFALSVIVFSASDGFQGLGTLSTLLFFAFAISSLIYFVLLIKSKKYDLNNNYFRWAAYLNMLWFFGFIFYWLVALFLSSSQVSSQGAFDLIENINYVSDILVNVSGIIFSISFITFLIGRSKAKREL